MGKADDKLLSIGILIWIANFGQAEDYEPPQKYQLIYYSIKLIYLNKIGISVIAAYCKQEF